MRERDDDDDDDDDGVRDNRSISYTHKLNFTRKN